MNRNLTTLQLVLLLVCLCNQVASAAPAAVSLDGSATTRPSFIIPFVVLAAATVALLSQE